MTKLEHSFISFWWKFNTNLTIFGFVMGIKRIRLNFQKFKYLLPIHWVHLKCQRHWRVKVYLILMLQHSFPLPSLYSNVHDLWFPLNVSFLHSLPLQVLFRISVGKNNNEQIIDIFICVFVFIYVCECVRSELFL